MHESLDFFAPLIDQLLEFVDEAMRLLPQLTLAVVVIVITSIAVFLTRRSLETVLTRGAMRPALVMAIRTLAGISVWILGILLAITLATACGGPKPPTGRHWLGWCRNRPRLPRDAGELYGRHHEHGAQAHADRRCDRGR